MDQVWCSEKFCLASFKIGKFHMKTWISGFSWKMWRSATLRLHSRVEREWVDAATIPGDPPALSPAAPPPLSYYSLPQLGHYLFTHFPSEPRLHLLVLATLEVITVRRAELRGLQVQPFLKPTLSPCAPSGARASNSHDWSFSFHADMLAPSQHRPFLMITPPPGNKKTTEWQLLWHLIQGQFPSG